MSNDKTVLTEVEVAILVEIVVTELPSGSNSYTVRPKNKECRLRECYGKTKDEALSRFQVCNNLY